MTKPRQAKSFVSRRKTFAKRSAARREYGQMHVRETAMLQCSWTSSRIQRSMHAQPGLNLPRSVRTNQRRFDTSELKRDFLVSSPTSRLPAWLTVSLSFD